MHFNYTGKKLITAKILQWFLQRSQRKLNAKRLQLKSATTEITATARSSSPRLNMNQHPTRSESSLRAQSQMTTGDEVLSQHNSENMTSEHDMPTGTLSNNSLRTPYGRVIISSVVTTDPKSFIAQIQMERV